MNAFEIQEPVPNPELRHAEAEWRRLLFEGEWLMFRADYQNARFAYLAALSLAKSFAPAHPFWNKTLANLRYLYVNYICPPPATLEDLVVAIVPEWEAALGENHFFIALWLEKCVKVAEDAEQYALMETMWRKILVCWDGTPYLSIHARQLRQLDCLSGIARAYFAQGKYTEAGAYFDTAIKIADLAWGPNHARLVNYLEEAAEAARQRGDSKLEARYTKRASRIGWFQP